ncbi:hypothetical protein C5S35_06690 [Candidatus Methanophagaceae archaeon]|nr:hypothetical protein C5S35_06690 [Methanophagales archaeon]
MVERLGLERKRIMKTKNALKWMYIHITVDIPKFTEIFKFGQVMRKALRKEEIP